MRGWENDSTRAAPFMRRSWNVSRQRYWRGSIRPAGIWTRCVIWRRQRGLAQLEAEGLVRTERTTGRFVTEDTALLEKLRDEMARAVTAEYLEKMRGIGYGPAQAAALVTGWETKESERNE